ncbi:MAG TPA: hypothetical protein VIN59_08760 [Alphaproteobacteria bacterium]
MNYKADNEQQGDIVVHSLEELARNPELRQKTENLPPLDLRALLMGSAAAAPAINRDSLVDMMQGNTAKSLSANPENLINKALLQALNLEEITAAAPVKATAQAEAKNPMKKPEFNELAILEEVDEEQQFAFIGRTTQRFVTADARLALFKRAELTMAHVYSEYDAFMKDARELEALFPANHPFVTPRFDFLDRAALFVNQVDLTQTLQVNDLHATLHEVYKVLAELDDAAKVLGFVKVYEAETVTQEPAQVEQIPEKAATHETAEVSPESAPAKPSQGQSGMPAFLQDPNYKPSEAAQTQLHIFNRDPDWFDHFMSFLMRSVSIVAVKAAQGTSAWVGSAFNKKIIAEAPDRAPPVTEDPRYMYDPSELGFIKDKTTAEAIAAVQAEKQQNANLPENDKGYDIKAANDFLAMPTRMRAYKVLSAKMERKNPDAHKTAYEFFARNDADVASIAFALEQVAAGKVRHATTIKSSLNELAKALTERTKAKTTAKKQKSAQDSITWQSGVLAAEGKRLQDSYMIDENHPNYAILSAAMAPEVLTDAKITAVEDTIRGTSAEDHVETSNAGEFDIEAGIKNLVDEEMANPQLRELTLLERIRKPFIDYAANRESERIMHAQASMLDQVSHLELIQQLSDDDALGYGALRAAFKKKNMAHASGMAQALLETLKSPERKDDYAAFIHAMKTAYGTNENTRANRSIKNDVQKLANIYVKTGDLDLDTALQSIIERGKVLLEISAEEKESAKLADIKDVAGAQALLQERLDDVNKVMAYIHKTRNSVMPNLMHYDSSIKLVNDLNEMQVTVDAYKFDLGENDEVVQKRVTLASHLDRLSTITQHALQMSGKVQSALSGGGVHEQENKQILDLMDRLDAGLEYLQDTALPKLNDAHNAYMHQHYIEQFKTLMSDADIAVFKDKFAAFGQHKNNDAALQSALRNYQDLLSMSKDPATLNKSLIEALADPKAKGRVKKFMRELGYQVTDELSHGENAATAYGNATLIKSFDAVTKRSTEMPRTTTDIGHELLGVKHGNFEPVMAFLPSSENSPIADALKVEQAKNAPAQDVNVPVKVYERGQKFKAIAGQVIGTAGDWSLKVAHGLIKNSPAIILGAGVGASVGGLTRLGMVGLSAAAITTGLPVLGIAGLALAVVAGAAVGGFKAQYMMDYNAALERGEKPVAAAIKNLLGSAAKGSTQSFGALFKAVGVLGKAYNEVERERVQARRTHSLGKQLLIHAINPLTMPFSVYQRMLKIDAATTKLATGAALGAIGASLAYTWITGGSDSVATTALDPSSTAPAETGALETLKPNVATSATLNTDTSVKDAFGPYALPKTSMPETVLMPDPMVADLPQSNPVLPNPLLKTLIEMPIISDIPGIDKLTLLPKFNVPITVETPAKIPMIGADPVPTIPMIDAKPVINPSITVELRPSLPLSPETDLKMSDTVPVIEPAPETLVVPSMPTTVEGFLKGDAMQSNIDFWKQEVAAGNLSGRGLRAVQHALAAVDKGNIVAANDLLNFRAEGGYFANGKFHDLPGYTPNAEAVIDAKEQLIALDKIVDNAQVDSVGAQSQRYIDDVRARITAAAPKNTIS